VGHVLTRAWGRLASVQLLDQAHCRGKELESFAFEVDRPGFIASDPNEKQGTLAKSWGRYTLLTAEELAIVHVMNRAVRLLDETAEVKYHALDLQK